MSRVFYFLGRGDREAAGRKTAGREARGAAKGRFRVLLANFCFLCYSGTNGGGERLTNSKEQIDRIYAQLSPRADKLYQFVMAYSDHINEARDHGTRLPVSVVERGPREQYQ